VIAEAAGDTGVLVFRVDPQLCLTTWALNVMAFWYHGLGEMDFPERNKLWNFNAVFSEFTVEQSAAGLAVDQIGGHVVPALMAGATLPRPLNPFGDIYRSR
jgi:hypothetical protein